MPGHGPLRGALHAQLHAQAHEHGSHGGRGDHEGRGGRGGRIFGHGGLRYVLLRLIADKPSHGYELIRAIGERLGGDYSPSAGVVYPTLTLLEEQGFIAQSAQEGGRKLCTITPEGKAFLAANQGVADELMSRMTHVATHHAGRPPQVVRALENFKLAVRMRLSGTPLTAEQAHAFAAVLDSAAQNLEKI